MKAALLGAGEPHFDGHLRTLQALPEVDSIYIWGDNPAALAAIESARPEKVDGIFSDLNELLAQPKIFFAIITMRTDLKPTIITRFLESGMHVMVEKPIARTAPEVAQVVEMADRLRLKVGVPYTGRYHPLVREVRDLIGQGVVGPLMSVEIRHLTTQPKFRNPASWTFRNEHAGGGMLTWLGCHEIDKVRYITQDEIVSVAAEVAVRSGEEIDVEDVATLSLRFRSGAVGSIHVGYTMALKGEPYGDMPSYDTYAGVNGRQGRITWSSDGFPTHLNVETTHEAWAAAPQRTFDFEIADSPAYGGVYGEAFVRDFIRAAQGQGEVPASGRDGLQVARIVDAAYESSRTGRRIDVELP